MPLCPPPPHQALALSARARTAGRDPLQLTPGCRASWGRCWGERCACGAARFVCRASGATERAKWATRWARARAAQPRPAAASGVMRADQPTDRAPNIGSTWRLPRSHAHGIGRDAAHYKMSPPPATCGHSLAGRTATSGRSSGNGCSLWEVCARCAEMSGRPHHDTTKGADRSNHESPQTLSTVRHFGQSSTCVRLYA